MADLAHDEMSASLIQQIDASKYFDVGGVITQTAEADALLRTGKAKVVMVVPTRFSEDLQHQKEVTLQLLTDGTNPNLASTVNTYLSIIVRGF